MKKDPSTSGAPINVLGTELSNSDTHERYREKIARITLDSMVQFVGLLDTKGTVLEINKVALDAVGIKLSDVAGKLFWDTFWWQVSDEINATLRESIARAAQGEFVRWDTPIYGRAGGKETIIIDASLMPVRDEQGNVVFIAGEGRDITEKKAYEREIARQREELAQLDKLKTQFFANISHEFRTPLTLMLGPLEGALDDAEGLSAENRERLELAHRNALRQLKLVNTLLDFSRIEAGRIEAVYEPVDLAALTADLASVFRSAIERAGMKFIVDCPPLPEPVYVDREMWEKIVLNLLSNAFKFAFEGEIRVTLRQAGEAVELIVSDTGTGIPAEELPHLFERFHRVKGAQGRSYEGSGIGLALVQELVKLHGGSVRVQSELDRGSAFTVTVPLGKAHLPADHIETTRRLASTGLRAGTHAEEAARWLPDSEGPLDRESAVANDAMLSTDPAPTTAARPPAPDPRPLILLADDNADMREYIRRLLGANYEVVAVADGEAALTAAREQPFDLVLTDVMMPKLDGFGLLKALRADDATRAIPVILLSARAGEESRVEGLEAGADDYLIKPFSARELLTRVESHLKLQRVRREGESGRAFLADFSEQLLMFSTSTEIIQAFGERARDFLGASICAFIDINEANDVAIITDEWRRADGPTLAGKYDLPEYVTDEFRALMSAGKPVVVRDVAQDSRIRDKEKFAALKIGAFVNVPLIRDGAWRFALGVYCEHPYNWRNDEVALLLEATNRIWNKLERTRAEAALLEADRRKDEFLAILAHELRNPLAPIRNAMQILRVRGPVVQEVQWAYDVVNRQVDQMTRLVDDLLDVSRITRGKIELRKQRVELRSVVNDAVESIRPLVEQWGHQLTVELPQEPVYLEADPTRLAQVLLNLLNNAVKYTERGGHIRLTAVREGNRVIIRVKDTGVGIPADMLPRIFEMFRQVDSALDRSQGGLGIGLTLVQRLVTLHGGDVEAQSQGPGQGSEFIVRLPAEDMTPTALKDSAGDAASPAVARRRILVVDDNEDSAETLAIFLGMAGHDIRTAHDGLAAVAEAEAFQPDIILLDIGLPKLNGYEAAERIREQRGDGVVLIALTGWGQEENRRRSKEAGFNYHLTKPLDFDDLNKLLVGLNNKD